MNYLISNVINVMCPINLVECYIILFVKIEINLQLQVITRNSVFSKIDIS